MTTASPLHLHKHLARWPMVSVDIFTAVVLLLIGEAMSLALGLNTGITSGHSPVAWLLFSAAMGGAIALRSLEPTAALALIWLAAFVQMVSFLDVVPLDAGILLVLYSVSVQPDTLRNQMAWVTALSAIPLSLLFFMSRHSWVVDLGEVILTRPSLSLLAGLLLVLCATFIAPVLIGTLVRAIRRGEADRMARQAAEAQTVRAQQLAQDTVSREQIARDVHDMVGHSLTVIIAQAESMAFLPPDDPRYMQAGTHIATTAREALTEVRRIVDVAMQGESGDGSGAEAATRTLMLADAPDLIARLRDTGWQVAETSDGIPQAIAPDVSAAGAAALREVVTNVLKHGDRQQQVQIAWTWSDVLRLTVENAVRPVETSSPSASSPSASSAPRVGRGLIGTRERLAEANGTFTAHPIADNRYRATISVPLTPDRQTAS